MGASDEAEEAPEDTPLQTLRLFAVDCQTTGATPTSGHLIELGWGWVEGVEGAAGGAKVDGGAGGTKVDGGAEVDGVDGGEVEAVQIEVEATLVALPAAARVPARVRKLTGIGTRMVRKADAPEVVLERFDAALRSRAPQAAGGVWLGLIHYARFEMGFLRHLYAAYGEGRALALAPICTHEIARRLYPGLPRRSLRAMAGFYGHHPGELLRAGPHVEATAAIWAGQVEALAARGVETLGALRAWLEAPAPSRPKRRVYPMARERRLQAPRGPGVYRMLGGGGQVLYVGKATSLRARVNSYFQKQKQPSGRTLEWLSQARDLALTPTATALEAALLEVDEIKRLAPPYNVALREGERALAFTSPSLDAIVGAPDATHRLGPLRSAEAIAPLVLLRLALEPEGLLTARPEAALVGDLDLALVQKGAALLRGRGASPGPCGVLRLGAALWRARLAVATDDDAASDADADDDAALDDVRPVDGPEAMAEALAAIALRGARRVRLGAWLMRLSEATVCWSPAGDGWRWLAIEGGQVAGAGDLKARPSDGARGGDEVSPTDGEARPGDDGADPTDLAARPGGLTPAGHARSRVERLARFDVATYDRLRVLTTELRRLVRDGRAVRVHLGPTACVDSAGLRRLFRWI